jgi:putative oxidoreductase
MSTDRTDYAALLLRLSLGTMFLAHGLMKVLMLGLPATVKMFEGMGYPGAFAYLVLLGELGGGVALLLGAWTRIIAAALLPLMIGVVFQHFGKGWMFARPGGGWEFPAFWTVALVVQSLLGPGKFAIDPLALLRRLASRPEAAAAR